MAEGVRDPALAIPPLIDALGDPVAEIRMATLEALGVIAADGDSRGPGAAAIRTASEALIGALKDREPVVRIAAIQALMRVTAARKTNGPIDPKATIDAIAASLNDGDGRVRGEAFRRSASAVRATLATRRLSLVAGLESRLAGDRARSVWLLGHFGCSLDRWLSFLLRSLEHDEPEVQAACRAAFTRAKPPAFSATAIPALVAALGSSDANVRACAGRALEPHAGDPRAAVAIPGLLAVLREPIVRDARSTVRWLPHLPPDFHDVDPAMPAIRFLGRRAPVRSRRARSSRRWPRSSAPAIRSGGKRRSRPWASSARRPSRPSLHCFRPCAKSSPTRKTNTPSRDGRSPRYWPRSPRAPDRPER